MTLMWVGLLPKTLLGGDNLYQFEHVIKNGTQKIEKYMTIDNAIWSTDCDSIIIQKPDGEFITYLKKSLGRAAKGGHK